MYRAASSYAADRASDEGISGTSSSSGTTGLSFPGLALGVAGDCLEEPACEFE